MLTPRSKFRGPNESVDCCIGPFEFTPPQISNAFSSHLPSLSPVHVGTPLFFQRRLPPLALHNNPSSVSCIQHDQQSTVSTESFRITRFPHSETLFQQNAFPPVRDQLYAHLNRFLVHLPRAFPDLRNIGVRPSSIEDQTNDRDCGLEVSRTRGQGHWCLHEDTNGVGNTRPCLPTKTRWSLRIHT